MIQSIVIWRWCGFLKVTRESLASGKRKSSWRQLFFSNASFDVGDKVLILFGCIVLSYASTKLLSAERLGNDPFWIGDMILATAGVVGCSWHEKCNVAILLGDI